MFGDPHCQISEAAECISVARYQFAFAVLDVGESAKAIDLEFVYELIGVEWFRTA